MTALTPLEAHLLTCAAYRKLILDALQAGDKVTAEMYQRALREIEQRRPADG